MNTQMSQRFSLFFIICRWVQCVQKKKSTTKNQIERGDTDKQISARIKTFSICKRIQCVLIKEWALNKYREPDDMNTHMSDFCSLQVSAVCADERRVQLKSICSLIKNYIGRDQGF